MKYASCLAPLLLLPALFGAAPALSSGPALPPRLPADSPQRAVSAFLKFHLAHPGGLTPAVVAARKPWLAPLLVHLLEREMSREAAFRRKHPNEAPFIDADVFLSSQEVPEGFTVTAPVGREVAVRFRYGSETRLVRYRMRLTNARSGTRWQIEDIIADGESLQKTLRRPVYEEAGGKAK